MEKSAYSASFPGRSPLPGLLAERGVDTVLITGTLSIYRSFGDVRATDEALALIGRRTDSC
ncbi:hypothetical protein ACFV1W_37010 [Kitasatospora sp. NPDC059648]|uniref:hypothetical protein n=1 Tax=Kitasatospora sp. NPDC059648 TaxID=3346894 RepID=UPI0036BC36BA